MVELNINEGQRLELSEKGSNIKYTMRISDIFDIANVTASYTNSFSLPKTPQNTYVLQQLGISGDNSEIPYNRVPANLKSDGYDIIKKGWLSVKETTDEYKVNIIDGMIDFFKQIENKTIGVDMDLSQFNHTKDLVTVINSMYSNNTAPYTYIVADYNGENYSIVDAQYGINIDYLIPCFNVRRLWDLMFTTFGFSYNIDDIPYINNLYITYPLPPEQEEELEQIGSFTKNFFATRSFFNVAGGKAPNPMKIWDSYGLSGGATLVDGRKIRVPSTGGYKIVLEVEAYLIYFGSVSDNLRCNIIKNGEIIGGVLTNSGAIVNFEYGFQASQGDLIEVILWWEGNTAMANYAQIRSNKVEFDIYKTNIGEVSLTNSFKDFKIKDFFKEIIWRTGLTPILDSNTNHMKFVKLSSRLDRFQAIDWSDKFIRRVKESYVLGDYAQKNRFRLKHDNEQDTTGDGFLNVTNFNLPDEKIIADSRMYAPDPTFTPFTNRLGVNTFSTYKYRIWEREPKENEEGDIVIDYKGLSNRFYFMRINRAPATSYRLVSSALNASFVYGDTLPYASNDMTMFEQTVYENYLEYQNIFTKFKAHDIELALSVTDVVGIDFLRPYYFKQENSYYILNALNWEDGKTCTAEFIRI